MVRFLSKKVTKPNFFRKTKIGSNQSILVRFLGQKPVQTGLAWFFWFCLVLARFFLVFFCFDSVFSRLGFFGFRLIKPKPN